MHQIATRFVVVWSRGMLVAGWSRDMVEIVYLTSIGT